MRSSTHFTGATQIAGAGYFAEAGDCTDSEGDGSDFALAMTGDLEGFLYIFVATAECSPGGTYHETGTETFVDGDGAGTFETTYRFTAKMADCPDLLTELWGRCQHPIVAGSGTPEYSQIEITGDTPSKPEEVKPKVSYTALSDSRHIAKGMQVALKNQWVTTDSKLWKRLNQLVELRSQGEELVVAASTAGVSMQLVEKLMLLGGKRLLEIPPQRNNPLTTTNPGKTSFR